MTQRTFGTTQILGFALNDHAVVAPPVVPPRRIEVIGDSISCGYGNEAKSEKETFSPDTENAYFAYGAMTARKLNADFECIAWSGRKLWPDNTIPSIYDLVLPTDTTSVWTAADRAWKPDAILIDLGTNDFFDTNPNAAKWTAAYEDFVAKLRQLFPAAEIYCALGPCMSDQGEGDRKPYTTLTNDINSNVAHFTDAGDSHVHVIEFEHQKRENGLGADFHPSIRTHEIMAAVFAEALKRDLK